MEYSTVSPISILVGADEKLIRWSLRERLEQAGYQVVVAGAAVVGAEDAGLGVEAPAIAA